MTYSNRLRLGTDPLVRAQFGSSEGDPSGFQGWREREQNLLIGVVQEELERIIRSTSVDISTMVPHVIPVYIKPKNVRPNHTSLAAHQMFGSRTVTDQYGILRNIITRKTPAAFLGIALGFEPSDMASIDRARDAIRHELIHALTVNAIEIYEMLTEGMVESLSVRDRVVGVPDWETMPWDSDFFQGTCGLWTSDFTQLILGGTPEEQADLYRLTRIIAIAAFQRQTRDQLWSICKILHERTLAQNSYSNFGDFCDATNRVLSRPEAEKLLRKHVFQEMTQGKQSFLLPFQQPHPAMLAQSMMIHPNAEYGLFDSSIGDTNYYPFVINSAPSTIGYNIRTASDAGGTMRIEHEKPFAVTKSSLARILLSRGIKVMTDDITLLTCQVQSLYAQL